MISPDEALELVLREARACPPRAVPLGEACGLRLAEAVVAEGPFPPFARALRDGFAVRAADAGKTVQIAGEVAAGEVTAASVVEGICLEIMTGAACPAGTEAVVPKEEVSREGDRVTLPETISPCQHIAQPGSECRAGQIVLEPGATITPLAVAVLASLGRKEVRVVPRPSLAVITTGGELVGPGEEPAWGQIRDSNGPMLAAMARNLGLSPSPHLHAADREESILATLQETAAYDVVVLTGGVSVGRYDLVPEGLKTYGAEIVFHRVSQRPGRPLLLARKGARLLFGLPGNPLGVHFCFHRYVTAAVRQMEGKPAAAEPCLGRLTAPVEHRGRRTYFVTARAERGGPPGDEWRVHPLPGVTSADVFTPCGANCYAELPPGEEVVPAGAVVSFTWIAGASDFRKSPATAV
jgi:molybdenum cofactor synthesis domain-containing protein